MALWLVDRLLLCCLLLLQFLGSRHQPTHEIPEGREDIKLQLSRAELTTRLGRKFPVDLHSRVLWDIGLDGFFLLFDERPLDG